MLISFLEKRPEKKTPALPKRYPTVAIIIPCWNKAKTLAATVHSLLDLEYPKDKLSIVIVDDGSTDNTYETALQFKDEPRVTVFKKENEGSKFGALNFGLDHSQSELVGCLDADSFVARDALLEIVKEFEADPQTMAVAPAMKVNRPKNLLEWMQAVEYTFGIFYKKMFDNIGAISVLPGPFSIYRREVFEKIGPFRRAHHTEDMEMAFRMQSNHMQIVNAHHAIVSTNVPANMGALVRQRTRWSRGFLENSRDYSYMYFNPKYGHFGLLILPFGLAAFMAGLYSAGYVFYHLGAALVGKLASMWATRIPLHLPHLHLEWFYLNTSMLTFLVIAVMDLTLTAILLGKRMAETELSFKSFVSYFFLFGILAPFWLARATWDTVTSKESGWLT